MADKPLRGTLTERHLLTAFLQESRDHLRYEFYAKQAKKDGFVRVSAMFLETAEHERTHAKRFLGFLQPGRVEVAAAFDLPTVGSTRDNLLAAADTERREHAEDYPAYAAQARHDGFPEIAAQFMAIANAERHHERRFRALAERMDAGETFVRADSIAWRCLHCGFVHQAAEAASTCPACHHPQEHFEPLCECW